MYALHGRSIVWPCLPRGPGSASWPYQCWVMVVFPACNKSIRWHRMSAASRVGTPSMYPLAPAMVLRSALQSKEALCGQGGGSWVPPNIQHTFSANNWYCTSVCLRSKIAAWCWQGSLRALHLQFTWSLPGEWVIWKVLGLIGQYVVEWQIKVEESQADSAQ